MKRILLVFPTMHDYTRSAIRGIHAFESALGRWRCILTYPEAFRERRQREFLLRRRYDGILGFFTDPRLEQSILQLGLPALNLSDAPARSRLPQVVSDNVRTGHLAAAHLLDCGLRHFLYLHRPGVHYSMLRSRGFTARIHEADMPCATMDVTGPSLVRVLRWIRNQPGPVGVMAAHDALARKLVEECQENDITVPDKAAVVSGDDTDLYSQAGTLPLTSVPSLGEAVGREAARLLDEWLERGRRPPDRTLIPPAPVVVRESTLMMAGLDPATGAALHHLRQHAVEGINVEDVVRACGLCRRTFDRALVNILGRTAHAEIERIRLERSEVLLRTTTLSVNTVARRSGFSSGNYFRTVFKKHYRMTASEFRSRNGQSRAA